MSVHYKFKSNLDHDTVTFDGLSISVTDLKKSIMQQKRIGKSSDFDLQITNAQTKEVYDSDEMLVPKNTSVIVARVPVAAGSKKNWDKRPDLPLPIDDDDLGQIRYDRIVKNADIANANTTEEDKVKAMITQSSQEYDPSKYVKSRSMTGPLPPTYTCFRCGKQGHWIKNCPTNNPDVKHSTGIPRSFMVPVDGPEHKGALLTSSGDYAVPSIDHQAYKEVKKEKPPFVPQDESVAEPEAKISEELLCMVCKDLLQDAVLIPCCGNSFCDECVRQVLLESDNHECPVCHETEVSPNTLIPNRFLRTAVLNLKKNETAYSRVKKVSVIKSPPVHIDNIESPQPSPDSTVENQPQQTEISSSQNDKSRTEERPVSVKLEMPPTPEFKIEIDSDVNESSQPPVSPKPSLDEDSHSQDVRPGTPLADEPAADLEQPSSAIQAIDQKHYHLEEYDFYSGSRYSRHHRDHYREERDHSSEPKPISTIETVTNMRKQKNFRLAPVRQEFPNQRSYREDRPDFYNRDRDDYSSHYDRRHPDRNIQRSGHHSQYNRFSQSRYRNDDYHYNDDKQDHAYDVDYDSHSRSEEPVRRHADRYRIPAHPVPIPPAVPVYTVASLPIVSAPLLPTPRIVVPPPQPPPPGASPVDTSHIAAQPPPPGIGPLLPPNVSSDPPVSINKPPLYEAEDSHKDVKSAEDRSIDDKIEAFQRKLEKRDRSYSRDRGSCNRSRSSDRERSRSSSQSCSFSSSKSWSRSLSRSSSSSSRSRSRTPPSIRLRSRSYSPSRSRSWSKARSYTRSRSRTRTTESFRPHSRSRAEPRFRRRVESRERMRSSRPRSRSRSYSPKNFQHYPQRNVAFVGRHYTPPQYGTSYQPQYGPPPAVSIPLLRTDYPPQHVHSIHPVLRQIEHYPIDRQPKSVPLYPEVYPAYNTYQQHPRYEREQRLPRYDKRQDYQSQPPEVVGHRIPGYIGDRSRDYKQKYRQVREPRKEIIRELPHVSEQEIRVVHTKELAEEPSSKNIEEKTVVKHKKHHHHHKSKESKKQENKIPVVIGIETQIESSKSLIKVEDQSEKVVESKSNSENSSKVVKSLEKVKDRKHKHKKHKTGEQADKKKKSVKKEKGDTSQTTDSDVHVKVKNRKKKKLKTIVENIAEEAVKTEVNVECATAAVDSKPENEDISENKPLGENDAMGHNTSADALDIFADEGETAILSEAVPETDSNEIEGNIPAENEENVSEHVEEEIEEDNISSGDEVEENAEEEGLQVDVPVLSKWEKEEFEDNIELRPQRKSTVVIPKEEKGSLSSDIIHRAELAILSKPVKPQIVSKDKSDSNDSSDVSSPDVSSQHKEPELKSVVHTERRPSPALQLIISATKEKRSVHKKEDKGSKELSERQLAKLIKFGRSNYGNKMEGPSSRRIVSTSSSKGADRGRDDRDRIVDRDRRRSPIRDLRVKLRSSSRDRRERDFSDRRERDFSDRRERDINDRRERDINDRRERDISDRRERDFNDRRERDISDRRERDISDRRERHISDRRIERDFYYDERLRGERNDRICRISDRSNDDQLREDRRQRICRFVDKDLQRPDKSTTISSKFRQITETKKIKKDFHDDLKFEPDYDAFSDIEQKESRERLKRKSNSPETSKKRVRLQKVTESSRKGLQRVDKSSITSSASSSVNSDSDSSHQKELQDRMSDSDHKQKHKKAKHKKNKKHKHKHKKKKSHKSRHE